MPWIKVASLLCQASRKSIALCKSPPERATGLLICNVKSNKELLLPRVTEAPVNTPGTRLGGRSEKIRRETWEKQDHL